LVVHGPLQAILLADHIGAAVPDGVLSGFAFRSVAPAFDTADLTLRRRDSVHRGHIDAAAFSDGRQTMVASATIDDLPETP
jgi:hydroxyacyl-ACP dehydratase HTD2-like protein with hotdog domain